jgi:hypothetical protein
MTARMTGGWRFEILNRAKDGREMVRLQEPLMWGVESPDGPTFVIVPEGFVSDFASMPWAVRQLLPSFGPWARAAVLHDYLYATQGQNGRFTRRQADAMLREAMAATAQDREDREPAAWKRAAIYRAVRAFGAGGWGDTSDVT